MAGSGPKLQRENHNRNWAPPLRELHSAPPVQTKLEIGKPGDKYEKQADAMADKVMMAPYDRSNMLMMAGSPDNPTLRMKQGVQMMEEPTVQMMGHEEEEQVQMMENEEEDPMVQMMGHEEEEQVQMMENEEEDPMVQMMEHGEEEMVQREMHEEEEMVQRMEHEEEEEMVQREMHEEEEMVQRMGHEEEEEMVQREMHEEEEMVQRMEHQEEEEMVQQKPAIQKAEDGKTHASPELTASINSTKGQGRPLPKSIQKEMGSKMGGDFSGVKVHDNSQATKMSSAIGAKAFTHGSDIYFNKGEYSPSSKSGKHLLAHELTHTIQQNGVISKKDVSLSKTGKKKIQGGFFSDVWNWIKKTGKKIGKGIASVAKSIWKGIKTGAIWIWGTAKTIAKAITTYGWNVIKSAGALVWTWISESPKRFVRLLMHLGKGAVGIAKWLWKGAKTLFTDPKKLGKWLLDGIVGGAAWVGRLFAKIFDLFGGGEVMDLIWQIIKFNTRTLSNVELTEAKKVFGDSISYWQVRIDEYSLIAALGSLFSGGGGMGVTTFHTINFNRKLAAGAGNGDMEWLIHELTHVSQMEHVGSQYIGEALHAQATTGYRYGGPSALAGKHLSDFNREQQGKIVADYYFDVLYGSVPATNYLPLIAELQAGKL